MVALCWERAAAVKCVPFCKEHSFVHSAKGAMTAADNLRPLAFCLSAFSFQPLIVFSNCNAVVAAVQTLYRALKKRRSKTRNAHIAWD